MARKMVRCSGGCGKTQDAVIAPKGNVDFTVTKPWTCDVCAEREAKRKARMEASRHVPEEKAKPDLGFTVKPRRVAVIGTNIQRQEVQAPVVPEPSPSAQESGGQTGTSEQDAFTTA